MVVWVIPFYLALSVIYFYPPAFGYAFIGGLAMTVSGLFIQIYLNSWLSKAFKCVLLQIDHRPWSVDGSDMKYWKWDSVVELWWVDPPKEIFDPVTGWTTAWLHLVNGGMRHPSYNKGAAINWVKFRYKGSWDKLILGIEGSVVFRGTVVDDHPHVDRVTATEMVAGSITVDVEGLGPLEMMNHHPPMIQDEGFLRSIPEFWIRRATGSIDVELEEARNAVSKAEMVQEVRAN